MQVIMQACGAMTYPLGRGVPVVEVLLIRVHPNLCCSHGVLQEVGARVRGLLGEHVTHVRAGVNLQTAPTLPHLSESNTGVWSHAGTLLLRFIH